MKACLGQLAPRSLSLGVDVVDARDVGLSGADDPEVFAHAQQEVRTLVSRDVDFADIIAYPPGKHHGIVVARIPSKRPLAAVADAFVRALTGLLT
jgi:predicted nuclease of predicted toxin-antitoxin system